MPPHAAVLYPNDLVDLPALICREVLSTDSETEREAKREPQKKLRDRIKLKAAGRDRDRDVQYEKVKL